MSRPFLPLTSDGVQIVIDRVQERTRMTGKRSAARNEQQWNEFLMLDRDFESDTEFLHDASYSAEKTVDPYGILIEVNDKAGREHELQVG